jgi:hypothetical protein
VIITEIIRRPVFADLTGDGIKEAISIVMQHTGGTGTFYYLVVASSNNMIESFFIGDRINVISVKIVKDVIFVEYLDRSFTQPMATRPSIKTIMSFKLVDNALVSGS